jgi:hypothetical protein
MGAIGVEDHDTGVLFGDDEAAVIQKRDPGDTVEIASGTRPLGPDRHEGRGVDHPPVTCPDLSNWSGYSGFVVPR